MTFCVRIFYTIRVSNRFNIVWRKVVLCVIRRYAWHVAGVIFVERANALIQKNSTTQKRRRNNPVFFVVDLRVFLLRTGVDPVRYTCMKKNKEDIKILYMQLRKDKESCDEEFEDMISLTGLSPAQFRTWNIFFEPHFPLDELETYDAMIAGGSSDDDKYAPTVEPDVFPGAAHAKHIVRYCFDNAVPTFASCMGFLIALEVLGTEIIIDTGTHEEGYYNIFPTEDGKKDTLFQGMGDSFFAISFHKKRAATVPDGCVLLAYSDLCAVHAFKKYNAPFYAFQFHPEMTRAGYIAKLERYTERYVGADKKDEVIRHIKETCPEMTESNSLLTTFIDRIVL